MHRRPNEPPHRRLRKGRTPAGFGKASRRIGGGEDRSGGGKKDGDIVSAPRRPVLSPLRRRHPRMHRRPNEPPHRRLRKCRKPAGFGKASRRTGGGEDRSGAAKRWRHRFRAPPTDLISSPTAPFQDAPSER
jgi:hypothetical protein